MVKRDAARRPKRHLGTFKIHEEDHFKGFLELAAVISKGSQHSRKNLTITDGHRGSRAPLGVFAANLEALRLRLGVQVAIERGLNDVLLEAIGKQQDGGFLILRLPGMQEIISGGESVDIVRIDGRRRGFAASVHKSRQQDETSENGTVQTGHCSS